MRILRNYILKECVTPFAICLGVLTFVFLLGYLPQLANKVINQGVDMGSVTMAFLYNIPVLLGYTLPIAALATVILTFGRFSSDNEIIAIRASGISLGSLLPPLIATGIVLSLVLLILFWHPLMGPGVVIDAAIIIALTIEWKFVKPILKSS